MGMHAQDGGNREEPRVIEDARECYDRIRYTLSDESGELRFTSFQIIGGIECRGVERELKEYLLNRPLRELDTDKIMQVSCSGERQCIDTIAKVIAEQQSFFAAEEEEENE